MRGAFEGILLNPSLPLYYLENDNAPTQISKEGNRKNGKFIG